MVVNANASQSKHPQIRDDYREMIAAFLNGIDAFYLTKGK